MEFALDPRHVCAAREANFDLCAGSWTKFFGPHFGAVLL
jgi:hypothetical protein